MLELLTSGYEVTHIIGSPSFFRDNADITAKFDSIQQIASEKELNRISALKNNSIVLAVAKYRSVDTFKLEKDELCIALDRIRDPGNLGTIIRTADWYGINKLLCSTDCADFYNPKTIQSSMGSFTRVQAYYTNLLEYLEGQRVLGAVMEGDSVHQINFSQGGIILIGNEAQGISNDLGSVVTQWISIPKYGSAESLNAAVATAVICDNIRRNNDQ